MPRQTAGCQRSVLSCRRCRQKKVRCDKGYPCSRCIAAKISCSGYDTDDTSDIPRSITQYLQLEIKRLESWLPQDLESPGRAEIQGDSSTPGISLVTGLQNHNKDEHTPDSATIISKNTAGNESVRVQVRADLRIQRLVAATLPSRRSIPEFSCIRLSLTPSQVLAPSFRPGNTNKTSIVPEIPKSGLSIKNLASIPPLFVNTLIRAYIDHVYPLHPFLYSPILLQQVDRVLRIMHTNQPREIHPDFDFLTVYIVLAISVSLGSATSGHGPRRMVFSEALFREGIQHLNPKEVFRTEMAELQVTLLILKYGTMNPRCASVWMLGGAAMRHCLKLGLHRELPSDNVISPVESDIRRRVFWMAYCFDTHICAALQYPVSLPDTAINSLKFSVQDDESITDQGILPNTVRTKEPAFHWLEYRQLHSDMVEVHFHNKTLPQGYSWEDWIIEMESKLRIWYERHSEDYHWTCTAYDNALTYLHRPSPRTPVPSSESLLIAFENACKVCLSYKSDIQAGYLRRTWLAAHHTFGSAVIVLFCLRHGSHRIMEKFSVEQIYEMTKLFTKNLQRIASESWPEASQFADVYERLLKPLIEAVFSGVETSLAYDAEQDAELARLLYPGTTQFDSLPPDTLTELVPPLFDDFYMPDWDLTQFYDDNFEDTGFEVWRGG